MTLVTEKEAAEKWCPLARVAVAGVTSNRFSAGGDDRGSLAEMSTRCIGSRCMAWRRVTQERDVTVERIDQIDSPPTADGGWEKSREAEHYQVGLGNKSIWKSRWRRTVGYCGTFGKVEP